MLQFQAILVIFAMLYILSQIGATLSAIYGKLIHHGKFVQNFTDVYSTLRKMHITNLIDTPKELVRHIQKNYDKPKKSSKKDRLYQLKLESQSTLKKNMSLLNKHLP